MTSFTATITIPITAEIFTTETTETGISDVAYDATEPSLKELEDTEQWAVDSWGWYDVGPAEDGNGSTIFMEGTLSTTETFIADNELQVFDHFSENYKIPNLGLDEVFNEPEHFYVSKINDGENEWRYDSRGFVTFSSTWKTKIDKPKQ